MKKENGISLYCNIIANVISFFSPFSEHVWVSVLSRIHLHRKIIVAYIDNLSNHQATGAFLFNYEL